MTFPHPSAPCGHTARILLSGAANQVSAARSTIACSLAVNGGEGEVQLWFGVTTLPPVPLPAPLPVIPPPPVVLAPPAPVAGPEAGPAADAAAPAPLAASPSLPQATRTGTRTRAARRGLIPASL